MANNSQAKVTVPKVPKVSQISLDSLKNYAPGLMGTSRTSTNMGAPLAPPAPKAAPAQFPALGKTNPGLSFDTGNPQTGLGSSQKLAPGTLGTNPPGTLPTDPFHSTDQLTMDQIAAMQAAAVGKLPTAPIEPVPGSGGATGAPNPSPGSSSGDQYQALIDKYVKSLNAPYSDAYNTAQAGEQKIADQQAALQQAYLNKNQGVKNRGIELGLEQGQEARLASQYSTAQQGLAAQDVPLKDQLAQEQAKRQAALDIAGKEFTAESSPMTAKQVVAAGSEVINPITGEVIASGQAKTTPNLSEYQAAVGQGYQGSFMDYLTAKKGSGSAISLTPEESQLLGEMFLTTGNIPNLGYGTAGTQAKAEVLHSALGSLEGTGVSGADIAGQQAEYKTGTAALQALKTSYSFMESAAQKATQTMDLTQSYLNNLYSTGSPILNQWLNAAKKGMGNTTVPQVDAAMMGVVRDYVKVINNSAQSVGGTPVSENEVYQKLVNNSTTPQQFASIVTAMKNEMGIATKTLKEVMDNQQAQLSQSVVNNKQGDTSWANF